VQVREAIAAGDLLEGAGGVESAGVDRQTVATCADRDDIGGEGKRIGHLVEQGHEAPTDVAEAHESQSQMRSARWCSGMHARQYTFDMSRLPMIALCSVLLLRPDAVTAQAVSSAPVVVMQGTGVVRRAPDQALVRITAEQRAPAPRAAQEGTAAAMTAVMAQLTAAGIPRDAVRTVAVTVQQEFDYQNGRQVPRGFVSRNAIEVRVDDLARLPQVLDASVAAGATAVEGLEWTIRNRAAAEREAVTLAVADAVARADAAAAGARRSIDAVVRIEESGAVMAVRSEPMVMRARSAQDAVMATPVSVGEIEVRASVTVTATLK